ncbi:uncharacterized protein LOC123546428 [Mercenaria mercenaria]|uniref:uncharacterized protein LOC123546428 n=1 Tax=Mercenaria mercenaria TaxID=6596 RepID=UPI00234EAEAA|nr:uncharacterized protein LOC123546428 [Mercenaria mercenaria]
MRQKQVNPASKYRMYSPTAMTNAYQAVREMRLPVKTAARQYGVPQTTLRDRVLGRIDPETTSSGPQALLSQHEEAVFVEHIKAMAQLGYGYSRSELIDQASNYAVFLGKRDQEHPLSDRWYRSFMDRWPELKKVKPRSLVNYRAQATSKEKVTAYFDDLKSALLKDNLMDKPEHIYNVDEKGIQTEHSPPYIICAESSTPAITSARTCITTILGCGNALGTQIPPYFIFKGKRMRSELLEGASPGTQGTVTESGWSNSDVFLEYLDTHFLKYVQRPSEDQPLLLIFDGHKSHITIPVINWAKEHNVSLFVLPAHTSHVLQPLDVGCYGPMQRIYNAQCHKFLRENPSSKITRYDVCSLACNAYTSALSVVNIRSAFKRTGIYPFNPEVILDTQLAPSKAYLVPEPETDIHDIHEAHSNATTAPQPAEFFKTAEKFITDKQTFEHKQPNKTISSIVSGKSITSPTVEAQIITHKSETKSKPSSKSGNVKKCSIPSSTSSKRQRVHSPQPGPSRQTATKALSAESDYSSGDEITDDEKCCACHLFQPKELQNCVSVVFTKWAQCDYPACGHWTHLKYCCKQSVVRLHDEFFCPCHDNTYTEE